MFTISRKHAVGFLPALFLTVMVPTAASATTLFSDNFSTATPGTYASTIPGSQFKVIAGNVDIFGILNGNAFNCTNNPAGNCLDLIGNVGLGSISSIPTFSLIAGDTYTITYGANSQGVTQTLFFSVSLGTLSAIESATDATGNESVTFTPTVSQSGASLVFTSITNVNNVSGPVLSNILLTQTAPLVAATPEPTTLLMGLTGLFAAGLGAFRRYRRA